MPSVAEQLRSARESQKLSIHQAAETTKIKTDHIRALEAGQFDVFIAPVYIRGFTRTYARYLRLDEAQVLADLEAELGDSPRLSRNPIDSEMPQRNFVDTLMLGLSRLNWRLWAGIAVLAVAVTISVSAVRQWRHSRTVDPLKDLGNGMYQPTQPSSGEVLPLPKK